MYKYVYAYIIQIKSYTTFWIIMMLITASPANIANSIRSIKILFLVIATAIKPYVQLDQLRAMSRARLCFLIENKYSDPSC